MLRNDTERVVAFMGRFASANPGMTLFTAATTTIVLAEPERILGGEEIVFDADGNPILISKPGIAGRTMKAGGEAVAHVSLNYVRPVFLSVLTFFVVFASLWAILKLYRINQREQKITEAKVAAAMGGPDSAAVAPTLEGNVVKREAENA